jgi:hypothetical protein
VSECQAMKFRELRVVARDCDSYVVYSPYVTSMAWTMLLPVLLLWPGLCHHGGASMV